MRILVAMDVDARHKAWLEEAAGSNEIVYWPVKGAVAAVIPPEELAKADIIIGNVSTDLMKYATRLQWMQLHSAGANTYCAPGVMPKGAQLTNATGAYGLAIAEHMMGMTLAMMKKLYTYYDNQKAGQWSDEGQVQSIYGATVLVIGFGNIGKEFGKRMKSMGAHVIGIRRRSSTTVPPEADEMGTMDQLDTYLARADIVASSLPETKETYHIYDAKRFAVMKKNAYFINVGRGSNVVQDDLCQALENGHLAGAAIDVTTPEPLPEEHPLWKTPNLYITPHISGGYHLQATHDYIVRIAADNLKRFLADMPLENQVDFKTGYKK